MKIALVGNPNSGKTTLFNALTGSNQFVGNWPGVTVEKKEGKLKNNTDVIITDLPGIYSLSPYTLEEVVASNYLKNEAPDVILNIVDGTNLERNLYLTTQLTEFGIPVVIAVNMIDVVQKNGCFINTAELSRRLNCTVAEISALKGIGVFEAAEAAIKAAQQRRSVTSPVFSEAVERALRQIEDTALQDIPQERRRLYAIKIFERDNSFSDEIKLDETAKMQTEMYIRKTESELDDDAESIISNERYKFIASIIEGCYKKTNGKKLSTSDKIDRVVTNRWAALPIFAVIMFLVYYISVSTVGGWATDWANDGVFGDGWHLFGIGTREYNEAMDTYAQEKLWTPEFMSILDAAANAGVVGAEDIQEAISENNFADFDEAYASYSDSLADAGYDLSNLYDAALGDTTAGIPQSDEYGIWIPGLPALLDKGLTAINCAEWLHSLILDGIVGGVGAVLGFLPQMIVLFILLSFLESCGYMSRIAFVLDRVFRKFGLSGKSFIPMLIGTGCGVPGIMASRTIENERDRRMTVVTTTFIPCSAKLPIIALIAASLFKNAWWVAPSAYFVGIAAIVISGIMLKKTKLFAGDPAPFVMELPAYHWPTLGNILRPMWERISSFVKRAGTVILLSSVVIWAASKFGTINGNFCFNTDMPLETSILGYIGKAVSFIFAPLGFGNIKATIATIMGLVAKEEVVNVFGVLDFEGMSKLAAYSFLVFNLLCAPCFAAMGAIKREMNSGKWTAFAICYQCALAYSASLIIYQFGRAFGGNINIIGFIAAFLILCTMLYMLFIKKYSEATEFTNTLRIQ